jgi:hypothetical protein
MGALYGLFVATMFMLLLHGVGNGVAAGWLTPLMILICVVALIASE